MSTRLKPTATRVPVGAADHGRSRSAAVKSARPGRRIGRRSIARGYRTCLCKAGLEVQDRREWRTSDWPSQMFPLTHPPCLKQPLGECLIQIGPCGDEEPVHEEPPCKWFNLPNAPILKSACKVEVPSQPAIGHRDGREDPAFSAQDHRPVLEFEGHWTARTGHLDESSKQRHARRRVSDQIRIEVGIRRRHRPPTRTHRTSARASVPRPAVTAPEYGTRHWLGRDPGSATTGAGQGATPAVRATPCTPRLRAMSGPLAQVNAGTSRPLVATDPRQNYGETGCLGCRAGLCGYLGPLVRLPQHRQNGCPAGSA